MKEQKTRPAKTIVKKKKFKEVNLTLAKDNVVLVKGQHANQWNRR